MISEEIVHVKGYPRRLVVFLHGYIDSAVFLDKKLDVFYDRLNDFAIHLPQSPLICEIHENNRQWYSMHRFDPNDDRKLVPTLEECVAFYDRMTLGLKQAYDHLVPYIEQSLAEYGLEWKDLILCGFSQGAMVALYIALMYPEKMKAVISFSGILAGAPYLAKHASSSPDALLIHGNDDNLIRFSARDFTCRKLEELGCSVQTATIEKGRHMITPEALNLAVEFINKL